MFAPIQPKATIFIPTYNRIQFLKRALESALNQTYANTQVVVLNNGSTDSTAQLLEEYRQRVCLLENKTNIYPFDFSTILNSCEGYYWQFLSDDDWLEPTYLEEVIRLWTENPKLVFVHARCSVESKHGSNLGPGFPAILEGIELVQSFFEQRGGPSFCATLFRSEDVRRNISLIEGDYLGDAPLWTSIAFEGKVGFVDKPLSHYQLSDSSTIVQTIQLAMCDYLKLARRCQETFRQKGLSFEAVQGLQRACDSGAGAVFASLLFRKAAIGATAASLFAELRASWKIVTRMRFKTYILVARSLMIPCQTWIRGIRPRIVRFIHTFRLII
jgi:hypothetical protein